MSPLQDETHLEQAALFSPLAFLRRRRAELGGALLRNLQQQLHAGRVVALHRAARATVLCYRKLAWDTDYFGIPTYRVDFMASAALKNDAIEEFRLVLEELVTTLRGHHPRFYLFAELPSEATSALQAAGLSRWRLVETRITFFREAMHAYQYARRFPVRGATAEDIGSLTSTAMQSRNPFDRFHAEHFFPETLADRFLSTFIENSVNGFSNITLVPNIEDSPPDAFLTANFLDSGEFLPDLKIAKMILAAVDKSRRGWFVKLISEMSYLFMEKGVDVSYMTTQTTNSAAIRTMEVLGYSLGRSTHIFAHVETGVMR